MLGHCELDNVDFVSPWIINGVTVPGAACVAGHTLSNNMSDGRAVRVWRGSCDDWRRLATVHNCNSGDIERIKVGAGVSGGFIAWGESCGNITGRARAELVRGDSAMELVASIAAKLQGVIPAPESIRPVRLWRDDWAGELDFGRFVDGADSSFRVTRRARVPSCGKVLRVTADLGGGSSKTPEQLAVNGAAGVALASLLESAGYRVEFAYAKYNAKSYESGARNCLQVIECKAAHDPLDIASLAATFAGLSNRISMFSAIALLGCKSGGIEENLGYPEPIPSWAVGDLHIGASYSIESAENEIRRALAPYMGVASAA